MSIAERGRAYGERKKLAAAKVMATSNAVAARVIQGQTDAELQEALHQALAEAHRHPNNK
ncbi:hypothetical protein ACCQ10_06055 [Xanthomonas sp. NCPPB 1325]|uniref:hypothetical protein n=1 Tax=Xanthomonas sp. NCPPB 1325 TaxID=487529 RepID=UPI0035578013